MTEVEKYYRKWGEPTRTWFTKESPPIYNHKTLLEFAEDYYQNRVKNNVTLGNVSKCSFDCDNPVYEEGASYCKEHMECYDWT